MWAIVKADKVISVHAGIPSEIFTGDKRYDQKHLFSLSEKEKQEIGLYPVTMGGEPDSKFHTVSSVQYSFSNKKVTQSFSSKDKDLDDVKVVDADKKAVLDSDGVQVVQLGLKTISKQEANKTAHSLINRFAWLVERKVFSDTAIPSAVTTYVAAVRTAATKMATEIDKVSSVSDLKVLYQDTYNAKGEKTATAVMNDWPSEKDVKTYLR